MHFRKCISFLREESGVAAMVWAITLPVIIGGIALGTDAGKWYFTKRNQQNATDTAALAAGYDIYGTPSQTTMYYTARGELTRNGLDVSKITLTANFPPTTGAYTTSNYAVEIIAQQADTRYFSKLAMGSNPTIRTRAVALRQPAGEACVLALETIQDDALLFTGSTTINLTDCVAAANSTDSSAITLSGNATVNVDSLYTAGGYSVGGSSDLNTDTPPTTHGAPITDPYSNLSIPSYSGCDQNNYNTNSTVTLNPGVYCNGLWAKSNARITLNPGTYIIDRGNFKANAGAQITGTDVTIILTSSTGSGYANLDVNGGGTISLSAPTSGAYKGVLFYQDKNAPVVMNANKINGNSSTNFTGAVYFPKQELEFSGNTSSGGGGCTKIVALYITFTGNSNLTSSCPSTVTDIVVPGTVQLVE